MEKLDGCSIKVLKYVCMRKIKGGEEEDKILHAKLTKPCLVKTNSVNLTPYILNFNFVR
jgi:hypothetical protein